MKFCAFGKLKTSEIEYFTVYVMTCCHIMIYNCNIDFGNMAALLVTIIYVWSVRLLTTTSLLIVQSSQSCTEMVRNSGSCSRVVGSS